MSNHPNRSRHNRTPAATPTAAEIRAVRERAELTQREAADLVYTTLRSWSNWESEGEHAGRRMHPAVFELFQLKALYPCLYETVRAQIDRDLKRNAPQ